MLSFFYGIISPEAFMNSIHFTSQRIYDKDFTLEFKGYSPVEVDAFLDQIIQDYQTFEETVEKSQERILQLEKANAALKATIVELEGRLDNMKENTPVSSSDILKRLSRLEELVNKKDE